MRTYVIYRRTSGIAESHTSGSYCERAGSFGEGVASEQASERAGFQCVVRGRCLVVGRFPSTHTYGWYIHCFAFLTHAKRRVLNWPRACCALLKNAVLKAIQDFWL